MDEMWRTVLLLATVAGFVITVAGLVAAYVGAQREFQEAQSRIENMQRLGRAQKLDQDERAQRRPTTDAEAASIRAEATERSLYWKAEYERLDLTMPTYDNLVFLAAYESRRLLGLVLSSTRRDFVVAGFGLLVSTAASAGSLYLAS